MIHCLIQDCNACGLKKSTRALWVLYPMTSAAVQYANCAAALHTTHTASATSKNMADKGKSVPRHIQYQNHFIVCVNELHTDN